MDRIFNINKPQGITSHDVVYKVRKILNTKKVGHTGTLDPDAVGVLPICVGRATKISDLILNKDKEYICEMILGIETDTYDSSGRIISEKSIENISKKAVEEKLLSQVGERSQYPPIYSALKVNGKKLCDLARSGKVDDIVIEPRNVLIKSIDIIQIEIPKVVFKVKCSKGTYVRSICHDLGEDLGVGGHMSFLKRTQSGVFKYENSITLEELEILKNEDRLLESSFSIEDALEEFPKVMLNDNAIKYYSNGGIIQNNRFYFDCSLSTIFDDNNMINDKKYRVRVYNNNNEFIGIGNIYYIDEVMSIKSEKIFKLG